MMSKPDSMSFGDPNVPVGGNILAHAVTHRIQLKKAGSNGGRKAKVMNGVRGRCERVWSVREKVDNACGWVGARV